MKSVLNWIHKIDAFGVPLTFQTPSNNQLYQTTLGGIATLAIYTTCLIYATYMFVQWSIGEITPKSSSSSYITDYSLINFTQPILTTSGHQLNGDVINPFDPDKIIILPVLYIISLTDLTINIQSLLSSNYNSSINNLNIAINLQTQQATDISNYDYTILFIKCNESLIESNQKCANDSEVNSYFNDHANYIRMDLTLQTLNPEFAVIQTIQSFVLQIEQTLFQTIGLQLYSNLYTLKENMLTSSTTRSFEAITGAQSSPQTNGLQYGKIAYGNLTTYASVYIVIQPNQTEHIIEMVHIAEVLAQIGSILNILLLLRYIICELNSRKLWQAVQDEVIGYYYPEFEQLEKKYTIFGKLKSVKLMDKTIDLDQFKSYNEILQKKAKQKLTLQNLVYENSRLYFLLRTKYQQKELVDANNLGIKLRPCKIILEGNIQLDRLYADEEQEQDQYQFNDDDFDAISTSYKQYTNAKSIRADSPQHVFLNQSSIKQVS